MQINKTFQDHNLDPQSFHHSIFALVASKGDPGRIGYVGLTPAYKQEAAPADKAPDK